MDDDVGALSARDVLDQFREYRRSADRVLRNELVERHLGLAGYHVKRFARRGESTDDLRQVAFFALVGAVERFDPDRGVAFSTFAGRTVEGELKRHFRDRTWSVRPPRQVQELHLEVRRAESDLVGSLGRSPTVAEVAAVVRSPVDHVLVAMEAGNAHTSSSLDRPAYDESPSEESNLTSRHLSRSDRGFSHVDDAMTVETLLGALDPEVRRAVTLTYLENLTQTETAERLGMSQSYLSRVIKRALRDLRSLAEA